MAHVVVTGAGIAGIPAAYDLKKALPQHEITLIGSSTHFWLTPPKPSVAVGWRKPRPVRVDVETKPRAFRSHGAQVSQLKQCT